MNISVGILAGGKSSRMGQNKALMTINGKRFIDKLVDEFSDFNEVLISTAERGIYESIGPLVVYDEHNDIGPIEGIYQIISNASEEYVFICAADMPFVTKELVTYMTEFISSDYDCYCLMDEEHIHPLCSIYSKKMLDVVENCIESGNYRLMTILNSVRTKYIKLEYTCFDKKVVKNINIKSEYRQLCFPVVFCVSGVKNSGKTWLIVKLINEFIKEEYSVGVIKHDGHDYVMDYEGTDTSRFIKAGARSSFIFSDKKFSLNCRKNLEIDDVLRLIQTREIQTDIIIIEGMKHMDCPRIEVIRSGVSDTPVCSPKNHICIATDIVSQDDINCPIYGINDIKGIFLCLKNYFGLDL